MKLGIFGGTYNPIHLGHLISAQCIQEQFGLDCVEFIPSKYPVHKVIDVPVSAEARYEMVSMAVEGNPYFKASRIEIDREEPSYTIITLQQLQEIHHDAELFLIVGADAFNDFRTWKQYRDIIEMSNLICIPRPGITTIAKEPSVGEKFLIANNPMIQISSSDIRERIKRGLSIRYLVPRKVEEFINKWKLYQN